MKIFNIVRHSYIGNNGRLHVSFSYDCCVELIPAWVRRYAEHRRDWKNDRKQVALMDGYAIINGKEYRKPGRGGGSALTDAVVDGVKRLANGMKAGQAL